MIDQDVSEVLDYEPGNFLVIRHVRPKLVCGGCQSSVQAAAPSRPVDRALAGIDPGEIDERVESDMPLAGEPILHKPGRDDFRRGCKVSFTDKYPQPQFGTIARIHQRTASVDCDGGTSWRIPFAMMRHILDI